MPNGELQTSRKFDSVCHPSVSVVQEARSVCASTNFCFFFFFSLKPRFHIYFLLRAEIRFKVLAELVEENAYESRQTSKGQPIVSLLMLKGTIT